MEKYLVSIIVPIYNSESTLAQCIESILEQTYKRIELILVDDGSLDKSETICRRYEVNDKRVHYYKKENGGVSSARNFGLSVACGDYVSFVDSDDWLEKGSLSQIIMKLEEDFPEYIIPRSKMIVYTSDGKLEKEVCFNDDYELCIAENELSIYFEKLFKTSVLYSVCGRLYSREFLNKNNLLFDTNVHLLEDFLFNLACLEKGLVLKHVDIMLYNVRVVGLQDYKYKRKYSAYFTGISKVFDELFTLIKEKKIPISMDYYDMIMNYWTITIDCILHSKENVLKKMSLLRRVAVTVNNQKIFSFCAIENIDTHYRVLFKTKSVIMFFIIYTLKRVKKYFI